MTPEALKPRSISLLKMLLGREDPVSISFLAKHFSVSPRTIRYDLANLRRWVIPRGMVLVSEPRAGIRLEGNPKHTLLDITETGVLSYQTPLSVSHRRNGILLALMQASAPITLAELADSLFVSRSSIKSDISILKKATWCQGFQITHRPGVGHYIFGDEQAIRRVMATIVMEGNGKEWAGLTPSQVFSEKALLDKIWQAANTFRIQTRLCLDGESFSGFVGMLLASACRVLLGYHVRVSEAMLSKFSATREHESIQHLSSRLEASVGMEMTDGDIVFLTSYLMELGQTYEVDSPGSGTVLGSVHHARRFAASAEQALGIELCSDEEFFVGLSMHIDRIQRLRQLGVRIQNPLLSDIKQRYPAIYSACHAVCQSIAGDTGFRSSDEEVGYIAMHVGAALERKKRKPLRVLVCTNGASAGKLLTARLLRNFSDIDIVSTLPISRALQYPEINSVDVVISTVPLSLPKEVIAVNPLLTDEDIVKLENRGLLRGRQTRSDELSVRHTVNRVVEAVMRHARVQDMVGLVAAITGILKPLDRTPLDQKLDIQSASTRLIAQFGEAFPSKIREGSVRKLEYHAEIAFERLSLGAQLSRPFANIEIRAPEAVELCRRFVEEEGKRSGISFPRGAAAFLAVILLYPNEVPFFIIEVSILVAKEMQLEPSAACFLEQLLGAAYDGAREAGISMGQDTLFDLALHLASTILLGQETAVLAEVAFHASKSLSPSMVAASQAMADRVSEVLGRTLEEWEATYLGLYAGASLLRDESQLDVSKEPDRATSGKVPAKVGR